MQCSFLIIKPQTALHYLVRCTVTYGSVQLCYFVNGFSVDFAICAV